MISSEAFSDMIHQMTGRPDIRPVPYFINTLASICRSGEYPEDTISVIVQLQPDDIYETGGYYNVPPDWITARVAVQTPVGLTVRRIKHVRMSVESFYPGTDSQLLDVQELVVATPADLYKELQRCERVPRFYWVADTLCFYAPVSMLSKDVLAGGDGIVSFEVTLLTSNQNRGFYYFNELSTNLVGPVEGYSRYHWDSKETGIDLPEAMMANRSEVEYGESVIWQLDACLDLVTLGVCSGILRFAGQEKEGLIMYQEYLTSLRAFKTDRANALLDHRLAVGR